ncbi:hypothetical protein OUZ56_007721 [Daphnia magna]|uniref:Uncharacterized protein n=1 Tax=Daphnia magna TaxID=35525 RepID=A0ABR0AAS6_9CRUS|nr:hypothetical protein OUZ56_007721 [Daphnia magna]
MNKQSMGFEVYRLQKKLQYHITGIIRSQPSSSDLLFVGSKEYKAREEKSDWNDDCFSKSFLEYARFMLDQLEPVFTDASLIDAP